MLGNTSLGFSVCFLFFPVCFEKGYYPVTKANLEITGRVQTFSNPPAFASQLTKLQVSAPTPAEH